MIGIFDSGVGGLTVVKEFKKNLPHLPFIYLGDNARMPYGTRGAEVVREFARADADFLIRQGATIIIIACNTASAHAANDLQEQYPAIKFFEVISPAAQAAAQISRGRIGIIGTRGTISSGVYEQEVKKAKSDAEVFSQACPLFVSLVEQDWAHRQETKTIARKYLMPLKMKHIDTLIMGCTHYPILRQTIQEKIGRRVQLVDPAEEVIKSLAEFLNEQDEAFMAKLSAGKEQYFATDLGARFNEVAEKWLKIKIKAEKAAW